MADGLPAIGIVAAVLGVIKTMSSIDQPPEVLGGMIGGALVGTFLGVFLAYCMVQPIAGRLKQIEDEDSSFYYIIRDVFVAMISDHPRAYALKLVGEWYLATCNQTLKRWKTRKKSLRRHDAKHCERSPSLDFCRFQLSS